MCSITATFFEVNFEIISLGVYLCMEFRDTWRRMKTQTLSKTWNVLIRCKYLVTCVYYRVALRLQKKKEKKAVCGEM